MAGTHPLEGTYHFAALASSAPELVGAPPPSPPPRPVFLGGLTDREGRDPRRVGRSQHLGVWSTTRSCREETRRGKGGKIGSRVLAAEVGALVGVLSKRVLGQYELVVPSGDDPNGDTVMFAGANVLHMERQHEFRPEEFRFWVALHECTHRLQFTGVPWMRDYFLSLVADLVDAAEPEPGRMQRLKDEMRGLAQGRPIMGESGLMGMFATPDQRRLIERCRH